MAWWSNTCSKETSSTEITTFESVVKTPAGNRGIITKDEERAKKFGLDALFQRGEELPEIIKKTKTIKRDKILDKRVILYKA